MRGRVWSGGALVAVAVAASLGTSSAAADGGPNPVAAENALAGDGGWRLQRRAAPGVLEGYASAASVNHGERIDVHVRADGQRTMTWALYRMGWYGGAQGRRILSGGPVGVGPQPTPSPTASGLIECAWPVTFTIQTDASWVSGVYLVAMTRSDGPQSYVVFVVRADERKGAAVVQSSVATWQAYNAWGGKSLYVGPAQEVSYDRPYLEGNGAGQYFRYEQHFVAWAESRGLDMVYVTNVDLDRDPSLLTGQRLFLSVGHDEYWSRPAREEVEAAIASGVSVAFLSGNSVYWQIRLEPAKHDGAPRRTQVCWKKLVAKDPLGATPLATTQWRSPPVNEPENALDGVMYTTWDLVDGAWVVADAGHWLFEGTGLSNGDGIPAIAGYETDRTVDNGRTPPGTEVVARSPVIDVSGRPERQESAVRDTDAGGFVFGAGAIQWAWGLNHPRHADARLRRITENVFRRAGIEPTAPESSKAAAARPQAGPGVLRSIWTFAGRPWVEGLQDGPASAALFRRPTAAAVDAGGNVFVADTGNHAIRMIRNDAARTVATIAGDGTPGTALGDGASARLDTPTGIAVGPDGTVYVSDTGNQRILRLRPSGGGWSSDRLAGDDGDPGFRDGSGADARFQNPGGLAFAAGKLYVADRQNNAIRRVDASSGQTETLAGSGGRGSEDGSAGSGEFDFPGDVAAAGDALLVVDAGNRVVRRVSLSSGAVSTFAGTGGTSFDAGGWGDGPSSDARFMAAAGILADGGGVLVADAGNSCVRQVQDGQVTTIAGTEFGARDGAPDHAKLAAPTGLARLATGEWLVVDQGASTLRRLSANDPPPADPPPDVRPGEPSGSGAGPGHGGCGGCGSAGGAGLLVAFAVAMQLARGLRRRLDR
jgi:N,N-dimethylformamidase beta subunit-like protein/NHL repeat-containing protein